MSLKVPPFLLLCSLQAIFLQDIVSSASGQNEYRILPQVCDSSADCRAGFGEVCLKVYDGCSKGTCSCNDRYARNPLTGRCMKERLGGEKCAHGADKCPDRMQCVRGSCRCMTGKATQDEEFCLETSEKLIGDKCIPYYHACYQKKDSGGYSSYGALCDVHKEVCVCEQGFRQEGLFCRKRSIGERGCLNDKQCKGDAFCVKRMCQCPPDYAPTSDNTRCAAVGAQLNVEKGETCDEIRQKKFCASNLMCVQCPEEGARTCVRYGVLVVSKSTNIAPINKLVPVWLLLLFIMCYVCYTR